jgi:hypothetical protein
MSSQLGVVTAGPWAAVECVRIPPAIMPQPIMGAPPSECKPLPLDTLGYPLVTGSDAHYAEHVGRRPFELDISPEALQPGGPGGEADLEALKNALKQRPCF